MPVTLATALTVYKTGAAALKLRSFLERFSGNEAVPAIAQKRDEVYRDWVVDLAQELDAHVRASREAFLLVGGTIEEHENDFSFLIDLARDLFDTNTIFTVVTPSGHFGIMSAGSETPNYVYNAQFLTSPASFDQPLVVPAHRTSYYYTANYGFSP